MAAAVATVALAMAMAMARTAKTMVAVVMAPVALQPSMTVVMTPLAAYLRCREGSMGTGCVVSNVRRAM